MLGLALVALAHGVAAQQIYDIVSAFSILITTTTPINMTVPSPVANNMGQVTVIRVQPIVGRLPTNKFHIVRDDGGRGHYSRRHYSVSDHLWLRRIVE